MRKSNACFPLLLTARRRRATSLLTLLRRFLLSSDLLGLLERFFDRGAQHIGLEVGRTCTATGADAHALVACLVDSPAHKITKLTRRRTRISDESVVVSEVPVVSDVSASFKLPLASQNGYRNDFTCEIAPR